MVILWSNYESPPPIQFAQPYIDLRLGTFIVNELSALTEGSCIEEAIILSSPAMINPPGAGDWCYTSELSDRYYQLLQLLDYLCFHYNQTFV